MAIVFRIRYREEKKIIWGKDKTFLDKMFSRYDMLVKHSVKVFLKRVFKIERGF